jgi:ATP-dependent DNA helicase RecG
MVSGPLTPADVAALAAGDEDSFTEFKSSETSPKALAKELCAFLNTQGDRVLIGVEDDHTILGLGAWDEEKVMNVARTLLHPSALPTWQRVAVGGADVGVVTVGMGREKPYAVSGGEGKSYYVRAGSTSRESSCDELIRLTQASGAVAPDLRPVIDAVAADLDADAVQEPFAGRRTIVWSELSDDERLQLLTRADILHEETGTPTVGGLLCFGSDPQQHMRHALIRAWPIRLPRSRGRRPSRRGGTA